VTEDLATNILASLCWVLLGIGGKLAFDWVKDTRPAARVWRLPRRASVAIVAADRPPTGGGLPVALVHPAEFAAATEIIESITRQFQCHVGRVSTASQFPKDRLVDSHLVVIGGPINNEIYRNLTERLADFPYAFDGRVLVDVTKNVRYEPLEDSDGNLSHDIALIVLTRNPLNLDRRLVILAGCRTFGCLGAARLLTKDHVGVLARRIGRSDATQLFVVKVPVVGTTVGELEILDHRSA
jgi:hypothetical protein